MSAAPASPAPSSASSGKDELRALLALLTASVQAILDSGAVVPSLNVPDPVPLTPSPEIATAISAATQLAAVLEGPPAVARLALAVSALRLLLPSPSCSGA